jgi:hypothetical protein
LWGLVGRFLQPGHQLGPVTVQDRDEFIVLDVPKPLPEVSFAQEPEVGEQLTQPDIG